MYVDIYGVTQLMARFREIGPMYGHFFVKLSCLTTSRIRWTDGEMDVGSHNSLPSESNILPDTSSSVHPSIGERNECPQGCWAQRGGLGDLKLVEKRFIYLLLPLWDAF